MSDVNPTLAALKRRAQNISRRLGDFYRRSAPRNALLAMRSTKFAERFPADTKRFAIFLVPGRNIVNGGIMSICSIATETQRLRARNGISVAVCKDYQ